MAAQLDASDAALDGFVPSLDHASFADWDAVYEPAEDTFLLLDALFAERSSLRALGDATVVEVGPGSGVVSAYVAALLAAQAPARGARSSTASCGRDPGARPGPLLRRRRRENDPDDIARILAADGAERTTVATKRARRGPAPGARSGDRAARAGNERLSILRQEKSDKSERLLQVAVVAFLVVMVGAALYVSQSEPQSRQHAWLSTDGVLRKGAHDAAVAAAEEARRAAAADRERERKQEARYLARPLQQVPGLPAGPEAAAAEPPCAGKVVGAASSLTLDRFYSGYGDMAAFGGHAPESGKIRNRGAAYLDAEFPLLDFIATSRPLDVE
ncbi:protein methyltransferase [Aureococcus anophagefferens]|nr:protein methyltransferase [Aureococcus anophagefferens]